MKRKMELKDVWECYGDESIIQTYEGFEVSSRFPGVKLVLPREFQVFIDGSLIDPARLLKMPAYMHDMVFHEMITPLDTEYLCGACVVSDDEGGVVKFYPGNPLEAIDTIGAVLIKMHWDMREREPDLRWNERMEQIYGDEIIWSWKVTDRYEVSGDWYFLVRFDCVECITFGLKTLAIRYIETRRPVYLMANEVLEKCEREKAEYRARIAEIVAPLTESAGWKVSSGEDETVLKNEVSPGHWKVYRYRYDLIGFTTCAQDFDWKEN